jgi:hypothetical protein
MRVVFAVLLGAVAIVLGSLANIAAMWFLLGSQFAFAGNGPVASSGWCLGMLVGGSAAALAGGSLCRFVAGGKSCGAGHVLVAVTLLLAISGIAMGKSANDAMLPEGKQVAELSFMEASEYAVSPFWFHAANLFLAPWCTWYGGRIPRFAEAHPSS